MAKANEYLEVVLDNDSGIITGKIIWPKSEEEISDYIAEEWMRNPILCLNHFGSRNWTYLEGIYNQKKEIVYQNRLLFHRQQEG